MERILSILVQIWLSNDWPSTGKWLTLGVIVFLTILMVVLLLPW